MTTQEDDETIRTNLEMNVRLRRRIEAQAAVDRRPVKAEILVLLEEAVERREKRK